MRPSSETVSLLNGLPTLSTPALPSFGLKSADFRSVTAWLIASLRSGVSSRSPSGAAKTTLSTPPCSAANSASIRSVAFCVSEPGISKTSLSAPPTVATRTTSTTTIPIHPKTTRQGCVAQARVQLASAPVASRSWAAKRLGPGPGVMSLIGYLSVGVCQKRRTGRRKLIARLETSTQVAKGSASERSEVVAEACVARPGTVGHTGREHLVADLLRGVDDRLRHPRPAVLFRQDERVHGFRARAAESLGVHDSLRRRDLAVLAAQLELVAPADSRPAEAVGAAGTQVDLADWHLPAVRAEQPSLDVLGLRERIPDELAGCVKRAAHLDLGVRRRRDGRLSACAVHAVPPSSVGARGSRRGARRSRPRTGGTRRPTRRPRGAARARARRGATGRRGPGGSGRRPPGRAGAWRSRDRSSRTGPKAP